MIEKASLEQELFVVLLPEGEVKRRVKAIQTAISQRYGIMEDNFFPEVHITIDRIRRELIGEAAKTIKKVVPNFPPVEIVLKEFVCYRRGAAANFLVMQLAETPSLKEFTTNLHQEFVTKGISTIKNYQEWEFHITVLSNLFARPSLPEIDFENLCLVFEGEKSPCSSLVERLEIWRPTIDLWKRCLATYHLGS